VTEAVVDPARHRWFSPWTADEFRQVGGRARVHVCESSVVEQLVDGRIECPGEDGAHAVSGDVTEAGGGAGGRSDEVVDGVAEGVVPGTGDGACGCQR
jgi:hypothetical protein